MKKGKKVEMEPTRKKLEWKMQHIMLEIRELRETGLKVKISMIVLKADIGMLNDDLVVKMVKMKKVEAYGKDLREKFEML